MEKHLRLPRKTNENLANDIINNPLLEEGESNLILVEKGNDIYLHHTKPTSSKKHIRLLNLVAIKHLKDGIPLTHDATEIYKGSLERLSFDK